MVGKDPHRPQGKTKDMEHMAHVYAAGDVPRRAPADKVRAEMDMESMELRGGSSRAMGEEPVGGSRPGVESRVRRAIEDREGRS